MLLGCAGSLRQIDFRGITTTDSLCAMHPDYMAMTNQTVLKNVGPALKDRNGIAYRRRGNQPENE